MAMVQAAAKKAFQPSLPATCEEIGEPVAAKNPEFLGCSAVDKYRNGLYRQERWQNVLVHPC